MPDQRDALMQAVMQAMAQRRMTPEQAGGAPVNAPMPMAPPDLDWRRQAGVPYQGGVPVNAPIDPQRLQQLMRQLQGVSTPGMTMGG